MLGGLGRTMGPAILLLAVALKASERRLVRGLKEVDAVTPEGAVPLHLARPFRRLWLRRLVAVGAVGTVTTAESGERYYLIPQRYHEFRVERRKRALAMLVVLLIVLVMLWWRAH